VIGGDISGTTITAEAGTYGTSGRTYLDKVIPQNESQLVSNTFGASAVGQGLNLSGGTISSYVTFPYVAADNTRTAMTVEAWVYIAGYGNTNGYRPIISKRQNSAAGFADYGIYLQATTSLPAFQIIDNASVAHVVNYTPGTTLALNTWYHVAGTWDGTYMRLYLNGVQSTSVVAWSGTILSGAYDWYMFHQSTNNSMWFTGTIDEARAYSRALSDAEIVQSYNLGNGTDAPIGSGCVAQWKLDNDLLDATGTHSAGSWASTGFSFTTGKVSTPGSFQDILALSVRDAGALSTQGIVQLGSSTSDTYVVGYNVTIGSVNSGSYAVGITNNVSTVVSSFDQLGSLVLATSQYPSYSTASSQPVGVYYNAVDRNSCLVSYRPGRDVLMIGQSGNPVGETTGMLSNIWIGRAAGINNTTASYMIGIGPGALQGATAGTFSIAIGYQALTASSTRQLRHIAIGFQSLAALNNVNAWDNVAIGYQSLLTANNASNSVAIGNQTGLELAFTGYSVLIGDGAAASTGAQSLTHAVIIGYQAGYNQYGVTDSAAIGYQAGFSATTAINNVVIGHQAGYSNTTYGENVLIGYKSGYYCTTANNVFIGSQAGWRSTTTGTGHNTAVGYHALGGDSSNSLTGNYNVAIGEYALRVLAGLNASNCVVGSYSGYTMTSGGNNAFFGTSAGRLNLSGGQNTFIGDSAGYSNSTGSNGVCLGRFSGYNETASNAFYVGNIQQASLVNDKAYSLLYGTFSGSAASLTGQQLTVNGKLNTTASSTDFAGLKVPPGTAPSSPVDGDVWTTTTGTYVRVNGVTVGPLIDAAAGAGSTLYLYNNFV
jgi:hypothetical protein